MQAVDYVRMQVELEYHLDDDGLILPRPGSSGHAAFLIFEHDEGFSRFCRHNLPHATREALHAMDPKVAMSNHSAVQKLLYGRHGTAKVFCGETCVITQRDTATWDSEASQSSDNLSEFGIHLHGTLISFCRSAREDDRAAEAYAWTAPEYRQEGLARQCVVAWAQWLISHDKVPFYTHPADDVASRALMASMSVGPTSLMTAYE